jgi:hypothetical protein
LGAGTSRAWGTSNGDEVAPLQQVGKGKYMFTSLQVQQLKESRIAYGKNHGQGHNYHPVLLSAEQVYKWT